MPCIRRHESERQSTHAGHAWGRLSKARANTVLIQKEFNMPAKTTVSKDIKPYPPKKYEGVNLNWLVLIAAGVVDERGMALSFENVVVTTYRLFPHKFSLLGYPDYPDAKRVHDALWRCTDKNREWLRGKTSQGFSFTERGRRELEGARKSLEIASETAKPTYSNTRRFEKLLSEVLESSAFKKHAEGNYEQISESECCHVLQGTLDSQRRVLRDNWRSLSDIATDLKQDKVVAFLQWLGKRFERLLKED